MITFIASHPHTTTVAALRGPILAGLVPETRATTYDALFAADAFEPGTYVFTDFERLHPVDVRLAARFFRRFQAMEGFRALNDPARVKPRYALLRALADAGMNDFDVYCADGLPRPRRFPVFLRVASDHADPLGDLIEDQAELDVQLRALEDIGIPLTGVLVVEFCGERNAYGLFEKLSFLKIGDRITLSASGVMIGQHWNVKGTTAGTDLVTPEIMRERLEAIRTDRHAEAIRAAFDIAGIDYGRADVGMGGGRFQVYEINTNPAITTLDSYTSDEQREARQIYQGRLGSMLHEIDSAAAGAAVPVDLGALDRACRDRRVFAKLAFPAVSARLKARARRPRRQAGKSPAAQAPR
jgi:hypothetical protein